jgi:hypothetical protein
MNTYDSSQSLGPYEILKLIKDSAGNQADQIAVCAAILSGDPDVPQFGAVDAKHILRRHGREHETICCVVSACLKTGVIPKNFCIAYRHEDQISDEIADAFVTMIKSATPDSAIRGCVTIFTWVQSEMQAVMRARMSARNLLGGLDANRISKELDGALQYLKTRLKELSLA